MAEQRVLGERYEVGDPLGRGGMAEVRNGVDLRLGRAVAVKLLNGELAANPVFRSRFRREALSAGSLSHPCIVAVFDSGEENDPVTGVSLPYIVMELVRGETLRDVLEGDQKLAPERALEVARDVLDALSHSHEAGIIHRDIKPANVMLTPAGEVKVMDFGIARAVSDASSALTLTAAVIGTAQYLSPEQARGQTVDQRSDVYSTGCLLFEMLAGRPPFVGETALSLVYQHVREMPAPPSRYNPLILPQYDAVVLKALAKDPADRYQSARLMREDIDRVLHGRQPEAALPAPVVSAGAPSGILESSVVGEEADSSVTDPGRTRPTGPRRAEPDDRPVRGRTAGALVVATLVLLLITAGSYGLYLALGPGAASAGMVGVPDVVGSTRAQAETTIRNASLTPRVQPVTGNADRTVNTVVSQTPRSGEDVATQSVITVQVNVGVGTAIVPSGLVGHNGAAAVKKLKGAGFTNVSTEVARTSTAGASKDQVVAVDPPEGASAALGQRITVTVASGEDVLLTPPPLTEQRTTTDPQPRQTLQPSPDQPQSTVPSRQPVRSEPPSATSAPTRTSKPSEPAPVDPTPAPSVSASQPPAPTPTPAQSTMPVETPEPENTPEPAVSTKPVESPGGSQPTPSASVSASAAPTSAAGASPTGSPSPSPESRLP